jgi:HK97 family phage major capsid protein
MFRTNASRSTAKGVSFVRLISALAQAKSLKQEARRIAEEQFSNSPGVANLLRLMPPGPIAPFLEQAMMLKLADRMVEKGAVNAGSTSDTTWAGALVQYEDLVSEFIELLRPATIAGKLTGMRTAPFNIRFPKQTGGASVAWVGEAAAGPASALSYESVTLGFAKAAGIIVIDKELAVLSAPAAEILLRDELIRATGNFFDAQLVDPSVAAVSNTNPASITHGITPVASGGSTATLLAADFASMIGTMADANVDFTNPYWIMRPADAAKLAAKRDTAGGVAFPDIKVNGGTLLGIPVVTSNGVPASVSGGSIIILVNASDLDYADENLLAVDVSEEAAVQMDGAAGAGAQALVSLWQNNLVGVRVVGYRNWRRRHDESVAYLDQVHL